MPRRRPKTKHTPLRIAFARPIPRTVRGRVLCFISVIIGLKGAGYVAGHSPRSTDLAMILLTQWIPLQLIGVIIVAVAGFAWFSSYCHHGRDRYGYDAITALAGAMSGVYLASTFLGPLYALQGFLTWVLIATLAILLRGLRDIRDEPLRGTE